MRGVSWERSERIRRIRYALADVAGALFWLEIEQGRQLSFQAGVLSNDVMLPEYDNDEALDRAEGELRCYEAEYERLKQEEEREIDSYNR